jgi:tRNA U34 2-thiouridine synthase MnmA/TrmU
MGEKKRAIVLFSGGLDSILAAELVRRQGVEVVGLHVKTGFFSEDVKERLGLIKPEETPARRAAKSINLPLIEVDISKDYCEVIESPRYGYGKNANPCVDCKIRFFRAAKELMDSEGFDFVVSGEVLNQRPKSQRIDTMRVIEKESGLEGLIVRPLSAKLLPPSIPELKGWVDREKFLDIKGKNRERQLELAKELGLTYVPQPSGGCLLTMEEIGKRIFDQLEHGEWNCEVARLVPIGRHFRLPSGVKVVVARNREEAEFLKKNTAGWYLLKPKGKGTVALLLKRETPSEEELNLAAGLVARYSKNTEREVEIIKNTQRVGSLRAKPLSEELIGQLRLKDKSKKYS